VGKGKGERERRGRGRGGIREGGGKGRERGEVREGERKLVDSLVICDRKLVNKGKGRRGGAGGDLSILVVLELEEAVRGGSVGREERKDKTGGGLERKRVMSEK
jgi:hypothetical protein